MQKLDNDSPLWGAVAWPLYLGCRFVVWATWPWREKGNSGMNADSYYDPPEAYDFDADMFCDHCESDELHTFTRWQTFGEWTANCHTCGQVSEVEREDA